MPLPVKVARIQEKLGLEPGGDSLVAAVREASDVAGIANDGGYIYPLVAQVDRLMAKLFGEEEQGAAR